MDDIFSNLLSWELQQRIFPLQVLFAAVGFLFLAFVIFMLFRTSWAKFAFLLNMTEFLSFRPFGLTKMTKRWNKITVRLQTANESEYKLAIIEADTMMDEILKRMNFPGNTTDERLSNITSAVMPSIDQLKAAHQVRDNIVHDPDYRLTLDETRSTIGVYEAVLREFDLI